MDIRRPSESVLAQGGDSIVGSVAGSETMMNKMVDLLVGPREVARSEEEEILFEGKRKGRRQGKMPSGNRDMTAEESPDSVATGEAKTKGPLANLAGPASSVDSYTARDLAALVQNFTTTHHSGGST